MFFLYLLLFVFAFFLSFSLFLVSLSFSATATEWEHKLVLDLNIMQGHCMDHHRTALLHLGCQDVTCCKLQSASLHMRPGLLHHHVRGVKRCSWALHQMAANISLAVLIVVQKYNRLKDDVQGCFLRCLSQEYSSLRSDVAFFALWTSGTTYHQQAQGLSKLL